jgi:hypothetical protein
MPRFEAQIRFAAEREAKWEVADDLEYDGI